MIRNLDELVAYTKWRAEERGLPELAPFPPITRPGLSPETTARLREALPGLPGSYTSILEAVSIDGVSLGGFRLTPGGPARETLGERLRAANDSSVTGTAAYYARHGVYEVAALEGDPVCVAHRTGPFQVGQVVLVDHERPAERPKLLASAFEQFLLIAANLDRAAAEAGEEPDKAMGEFQQYLTAQVEERGNDLRANWLSIAREVL